MSFYGPRQYSDCKFQKYDKVEVYKGRKVPVGTVGEVFWVSDVQVWGQGRFSNYNYSLGIKDDSGKVFWVTDTNCRLIEREGKAAQHVWRATQWGSYLGVEYTAAKVEANEEAVELEDSIYEDGSN